MVNGRYKERIHSVENIGKYVAGTEGVPDHKHYLFTLQLLSKGLLHWKTFPLLLLTIMTKKQAMFWEAFEGSFRQTSNIHSHREHILNNFYQWEK